MKIMEDRRMDSSEHQKTSATSYLIVPAGFYEPVNQDRVPAHFLFSYTQIEEILRETEVTQIPFSPPFVEGIAVWRERSLPVISLEKLIGSSAPQKSSDGRGLVIKTGKKERGKATRNHVVIQINRETRLLAGMPKCEPLVLTDFVSPDKTGMIPGVYQWGADLLMVADIDSILNGYTG